MPHFHPGRRTFLTTAAAAGAMLGLRPAAALADDACDPVACSNGVPLSTLDDKRPISLRPTTDDLAADKAQLARFQTAFQRMIDFGTKYPTDPRGWVMQAAIHGAMVARFSEDAGAAAAAHNVHHGWFFMTWHRAYLYFFERILAWHLAGSSGTKIDQTFRIPCWNWDASESNVLFPSVYAPEWIGPAAPDYNPNPLWVAQRNNKVPLDLAALKLGMEVMLAAPNRGPGNFYGVHPSVTVGRNAQGAGENKAHNTVHNWVGGGVNAPPDPSGFMGDLSVAAKDPLFFAHHANVDKTWAWYRSFPYSSEPPDAGYRDEMWTFYDEQRRCIDVYAKDLYDYKNVLRYHYAAVPAKYHGPPPPAALKGTFAVTAGHLTGATVPAGASVGMTLSDVPYNGSGTFEIFARGAGGSQLLGSFSITPHRGMNMGNKTDVFVLVSPQARALLNAGAKIVVQKLAPSGGNRFLLAAPNAVELNGSKATLFVH
jgi:polyphenol oxidase